MEDRIRVIADDITSPLGAGSQGNWAAVRSGRSCLRLHEGLWGLPEPFCASMFDRDAVEMECAAENLPHGLTFFEKIALLSASRAVRAAGIDPSSERVLFVLSTTKGNVELLGNAQSYAPQSYVQGYVQGFASGRETLHSSASLIAAHFCNPNTPVVVSNACISGLCAQIEAMRALRSGKYDYAVVTGADCLSAFIVSGFQSFKALSQEPCRPFDSGRNGLNLGEAAATIVFAAERAACGAETSGTGKGAAMPGNGFGTWMAVSGATRNDANHISGPSRTGEGSFRALRQVLADACADELAFVNVHGTATPYNDEMESIAINRAGLSDVPVCGLKGYFGHTLGAAGVLETIISMKAADEGCVPATAGWRESGVSCPVSVSSECRHTDKKAFIKLLSGFGGCNAAMLFRKGGEI